MSEVAGLAKSVKFRTFFTEIINLKNLFLLDKNQIVTIYREIESISLNLFLLKDLFRHYLLLTFFY